jgi:hypothetical protein
LVEAGGLIDAGGTVACELLAQLGGNLIAMFAFSCDLGATSFHLQILTTVQPGVGPFPAQRPFPLRKEVMWPSPRGLATLL